MSSCHGHVGDAARFPEALCGIVGDAVQPTAWIDGDLVPWHEFYGGPEIALMEF